MSAPGSAKAPDMTRTEPETADELQAGRVESSGRRSPWQVWRQVLIAELLNLLERRRYDTPGTK